jgi:ceramide glucosyltransferase
MLRGISLAGLVASMAYTAFAAWKVWRRTIAEIPAGGPAPRVTVAKPLHGLEPEIEENLRSFAEQDYPDYELIFAASDASDPAVAVARPLGEVIVAPPWIGPNEKVNSLAAIAGKAKGDVLVVSDSDMRVGPEYLRAVTFPFQDARVGAVTCLYTGRPLPGVPSLLGAMHINEEFRASVLVALAMQPLDFCLGATMAVRREALESIGGFAALSGFLADDYMLGHRLRQQGWDIRLAAYDVETIVSERSMRDLFLHELRWARTIRTVRPIGWAGSILTMLLPWTMAFLLLSRFSRTAIWISAGAAALRLLLHAASGKQRLTSVLWIPVRDLLTFVVYCCSHLGRNVQWKQARFNVSTDGQLHPDGARP